MGYLVRPSCPKCGDNADVYEIVVHSGKKAASGAAAGAALGSVVPGLGTLIGGAIGGALGMIAGGVASQKHIDIDDVDYDQAREWAAKGESLQFCCAYCKDTFFSKAQLK